MSLEFIHAEKGMRSMGDGTVVMTEHLYLTEDKTRVVKENDPAARWLWASPGQEVSRVEAERLGVLDEPAVDPEPVVAPEGEPESPKKRTPAANKQRTSGGDK